MTDRKQLGSRGEDEAVRHLTKAGFRVLERNWRSRYGEIDIVAEDRGDIVFVEVKLRRTSAYGSPAEAVTPAKQRHIVRAALAFVKAKGLTRRNMRFDVLAIGPGGIEHIRAAFRAEEGFVC